MKICRGVVKGNTVQIKDTSALTEGAEAWVLLDETASENPQKILERELRFLKEGFDMGRLLVSERAELYNV